MTRTRRSRRWSNDLFVRHPWTRYAVAALFMSLVAIRAGFVLESYPPSSLTAWIALAAGTVVSVTLVGLAVWRSKPTLELGRHPAYIALMIVSICILGFGLYAGLDWTSAGSINVAAENSVVRNLAIGASLGTVALFGFGSYRAGRIARSRRRATAAVQSSPSAR